MRRQQIPVLFQQSAPTPALPSYSSILIDTYGASEVWPLVDIASGTAITAKVNAARNGSLVGWDLQNAAGPVANTRAPYLDGTNDYGSLDSVSLRSAFSGAIGSAFVFAKVSDVADWSDGADRVLFNFKVDANNWLYMYKSSTTGRINCYAALGGGAKIRQINGISTTDWFMLGMSWKDSANGNSVVAYYNATAQTALTTFGAWAGTPTFYMLGSLNTTPSQAWKGWIAYTAVKFGSVWSATDFTNMYAALTGAGPENP